MKRLILFLFIVISTFSCSDSSSVTDELTINGKLLTKAEMSIYTQTGCIPVDPEIINYFQLFVDTTTNYRYLYGSKNDSVKQITSFWCAKFEANGDCDWEIIEKDTVNTYVGGLAIIGDGNMVVSNVFMRTDYPSLIYETIPTVISQAGSITGATDVPDGYIYTDVVAFDDFFFCTINKQDLQNNPFIIEYAAQIRNDGAIIRHDGELNIPGKNDFYLWVSNDWYIFADKYHIEKKNVLTGPGPSVKWSRSISLPSFSTYDIDIATEGDNIVVEYNLTLTDGSKETHTYKLSCESGALLE